MTVPATIAEAIEQNAKGPRRVQVGNQIIEQHPLPDQIAADKHSAGTTAATLNTFGLRMVTLVPPGAG